MDSFFSLFDPSEGGQAKQSNKKRQKSDADTKKNPDAPKGRRKGRRSQPKQETQPEESSFLCEPDLSTDFLVKDCSYIENYMEVKKDDDTKTDKPKRRNSCRKYRRKKNKVSPTKDIVTPAWINTEEVEDNKNWNNLSPVPKMHDENVGKNVNDLGKDRKNRRKDIEEELLDKDKSGYLDRAVYHNVIEKLEKVGLKDEMYLAGDFNDDYLENDFFYSSDDMEDYFDDDTTTDSEDSGEECYGSLPPEPRFGNVEYKLQLVEPCERRFQHLVTQLKWRLRSGGGSAVYVVGVRDCGALRGLRARALRASLRALRRMAAALGAAPVAARARRLAPHRAVAEVYIRKLADTQQSVELRIAVMGANEAGKSTLIGVLTQGELDNGRGSARLNMFRHLHEVKSGRTSSLSHEILGFDAQGNVVNYGCSELMTAERIGERSAKLVSFLDLAGHTKYQRTTLHGLSGYSPHYAMIVISATAGITRITEEHIALLTALELPFFAVISKCELCPANVRPLLQRLQDLLAPERENTVKKKAVLITDENMARSCVAPQHSILDSIDKCSDDEEKKDDGAVERVAVFPVSCVRGAGLNALHAYLLALQPPLPEVQPPQDDEPCEFQIDEIFHVGDSGPVVGGLLARGQLYEGDNLIIGPLENGEFVPTSVRSIYRNRVPCGGVRAGQSASLGLGGAPALRQGMVLLTPPPGYAAPRRRPTFGTCTRCASGIPKVLHNSQSNDTKNRKNVRRKNKNLLQDIANVENSLAKARDNIEEGNIYRSESDGEKIETNQNVDVRCVCGDELPLEDPNDPRGCLYFQATVHVLRHSTAISPGFQCSVHVGNVRQTAIIEGIMCGNGELRAGESAPVVFRFARCPEYLVKGRRMLFTAGLGTRAIGRITQLFPYLPST
ncbi:PREDICTED: GTP-binding protein 2-like [Papilio polytes]|uniref:GTP-binding protein 2-like n=1 Tax=Papilio polytes TaxID=76194 RepID=UPI000675F79C|nr:PREDICTED: GTP-binding protein 2-like [Papilio polytes]